MIQRIFHPIGQGAFYSERHENLNIVYDCGTEWKNRTNKMFNKVITQSFSKKDVVDILFISHFDYDHVSEIKILKEHVQNIKTVILPLLHDEEKILLTNIYRVLNFNILTLINKPQQFLGKKTKIIYVKPSENNENVTNDDTEPLNIDDIRIPDETSKIEIESGVKISLKGLTDWIFIPYNYKYKQNNKKLVDELKKEKFDVNELKGDPKYTINKIIQDMTSFKSKGGKKLKNIYDSLEGKINQNSMFLFSGPSQNNEHHRQCFIYQYYHHPFYNYYNNKAGCIYTGDGNLNIVNIKSIFSRYWNYVGTVQIPHHGDITSFNNQILNNKYCFYPISVGTNNTYGHPSNKIISEIISKQSYPVLIT